MLSYLIYQQFIYHLSCLFIFLSAHFNWKFYPAICVLLKLLKKKLLAKKSIFCVLVTNIKWQPVISTVLLVLKTEWNLFKRQRPATVTAVAGDQNDLCVYFRKTDKNNQLKMEKGWWRLGMLLHYCCNRRMKIWMNNWSKTGEEEIGRGERLSATIIIW